MGPGEARLGEGRLTDTGLWGQTGGLLAGSPGRAGTQGLQAGVAIGWLSASDASDLASTYRLCWQVQLASKLLSGSTIAPDAIGAGGRAFLLRETGSDDIEAVLSKLTNATETAAETVTAALAATGEA